MYKEFLPRFNLSQKTLVLPMQLYLQIHFGKKKLFHCLGQTYAVRVRAVSRDGRHRGSWSDIFRSPALFETKFYSVDSRDGE